MHAPRCVLCWRASSRCERRCVSCDDYTRYGVAYFAIQNAALAHEYNDLSNEIQELRQRARDVMGQDISSEDEEGA